MHRQARVQQPRKLPEFVVYNGNTELWIKNSPEENILQFIVT